MAKRKFPSIAAISTRIPSEMRGPLDAMRRILNEIIDTGNPVLEALADRGIIERTPTGDFVPPSTGGGGGTIDSTPPAAPTGLKAGGALASIILSWTPLADSSNIAHTEIWRSDSNDFSKAVLIGQAPGYIYADNIGSGATKFYYIRYVNLANVPGPFNSQNGTQGQTGVDAGYLLDVLSANPPNGDYSPLLYVQPEEIVIGGVTIPAGVYFNNAYSRNLSVNNAMLGIASVDTLNVKNAAIKSAQIDLLAVQNQHIGGFIQSTNYSAGNQGAGWRIDKNGNAEFNTGVFRGTLAAATGTFSGQLNAATGTFSGLLNAAGGVFRGSVRSDSFANGYAWPPAGQRGYYLGPEGILVGNFNGGGAFFQFDQASNRIFFGGELFGATGTFSGQLTAQAVNAVRTINIADESVSITSSYNAFAGGADVTHTFAFNMPNPGSYIILATFAYSGGFGGDESNRSTLSDSFGQLRTASVTGGILAGGISTLIASREGVPAGSYTFSLRGQTTRVDNPGFSGSAVLFRRFR